MKKSLTCMPVVALLLVAVIVFSSCSVSKPAAQTVPVKNIDTVPADAPKELLPLTAAALAGLTDAEIKGIIPYVNYEFSLERTKPKKSIEVHDGVVYGVDSTETEVYKVLSKTKAEILFVKRTKGTNSPDTLVTTFKNGEEVFRHYFAVDSRGILTFIVANGQSVIRNGLDYKVRYQLTPRLMYYNGIKTGTRIKIIIADGRPSTNLTPNAVTDY